MTETRPPILCVDDERDVLESLTDILRREFSVTVASGGAEALEIMKVSDFAVVMSDMRMPNMDGATFLTMARDLRPNTTRLLLTGQADLESAVAAVNGAALFRFLLKPCPKVELVAALEAAVDHHRLVTAERVLLEDTLTGMIGVLADILSLSSPQAFGRATRVKEHVLGLATREQIEYTWPVEVACLLSQIAAVTLPDEVQEKLYRGEDLSVDEQEMVSRMPETTQRLLRPIPRIEPVLSILSNAFQSGPVSADLDATVDFGSRALRLAHELDNLESSGMAPGLAIDSLRSRHTGDYEIRLIDGLASMLGAEDQQFDVREVDITDLRLGMMFIDDVKSVSGALLVPRGHQVSATLVERLRNLPRDSIARASRLRIAMLMDDEDEELI